MVRRARSARHARPSGRGALAAAYAGLQADVTRMRAAGYTDFLELTRLTALVDGLLAQITRLTTELAETRRELRDARTTPTRSDPFIDLLTSQVADLRATVATQQALLADMTGRVLDLLTRVERQAELTAAAAAPAPGPAPAPAVPLAPVAPAPAPAAGPAPILARAPAAPAPAPVQPAHVDLAARASSHVPAADEALDDETVLRLRLIRESFGR